MTEAESIQHQLDLWVKGEPWHNTVRDECCPDFSCCQPQMLWPEDMRQQFADAKDEDRMSMMFGALGRLVASEAPEVEVYVAGKPPLQ